MGLAGIAYLPTVESLWIWKSGTPPEPLGKWIVNVLITMVGLVVDFLGERDYLGMIYAHSGFDSLHSGRCSHFPMGAEK